MMTLAGRGESGLDPFNFIYENHGPLVSNDPSAKGEALANVIYVSSLVAGGVSAVRGLVQGGSALVGRLRVAQSPSLGWGPPKPAVRDPLLQSITDQLYRPGASIGNGGTADAIRAGVGHVEKGVERIANIERWIVANPDAAGADMHAAESMIQDLISALVGMPYPGGK